MRKDIITSEDEKLVVKKRFDRAIDVELVGTLCLPSLLSLSCCTCFFSCCYALPQCFVIIRPPVRTNANAPQRDMRGAWKSRASTKWR